MRAKHLKNILSYCRTARLVTYQNGEPLELVAVVSHDAETIALVPSDYKEITAAIKDLDGREDPPAHDMIMDFRSEPGQVLIFCQE